MIKIVLMDDEYFFRQAMKKYLSKIGDEYEVVGEAKNGEEGLSLIENVKPDIAFVDINMPIMSGLEMIEELSDRKTKCKFILVTGYGEFDYVKRAMKSGAQDYLLKPVDIQELKACVLRVSEIIKEERLINTRYKEWEQIHTSVNGKLSNERDAADSLLEYHNMRKKQMLLPEKVAVYIEDNCDKYDLSLEEIARTFAISRTALCQQFKEVKKMTIGEYINQTRMRKAKELMNIGFQNVSYISEKCGYEAPGYFSKCFKKYYGILPSEYIKIIENDEHGSL